MRDLHARVARLVAAGTSPEDLSRARRRLGWEADAPTVVAELERTRAVRGAELPLDVAPAVTSAPDRRLLVCGVDLPVRSAATWEEGGPLWLHLRGGPIPEQPAVAVVGTRRPTLDGVALAGRIAEGLAAAGVVVVSGMARGIDQAAHRGALRAGGPTVGVLGTGHGVDYPRGADALRDAVAASGGLVTEHPDGRGVRRRAQFTERNRILAGLADAVVVVEAGARSGALNTTSWATTFGRDVMVVPSSPSNPAAAGGLALLFAGAAPVRDAADVLGLLPTGGAGRAVPAPPDRSGPPGLPPPAQAVWALLGTVPASPSDLAAETGLSSREVLVALSTLEDRGLVRRVPAGAVRTPA